MLRDGTTGYCWVFRRYEIVLITFSTDRVHLTCKALMFQLKWQLHLFSRPVFERPNNWTRNWAFLPSGFAMLYYLLSAKSDRKSPCSSVISTLRWHSNPSFVPNVSMTSGTHIDCWVLTWNQYYIVHSNKIPGDIKVTPLIRLIIPFHNTLLMLERNLQSYCFCLDLHPLLYASGQAY